jgi:hypothetical protein
MGEIAVNQNSTIILPIPLDLFKPFLEGQDSSGERSRSARLEDEEAKRLYEEAVADVPSAPEGNGTEEAPRGDQLP